MAKSHKINIQKIFTMVVVTVVLLTPFLANIMMIKEAEAVSLACRNSPECMAAVDREKEANRNAASAAASSSAAACLRPSGVAGAALSY